MTTIYRHPEPNNLLPSHLLLSRHDTHIASILQPTYQKQMPDSPLCL